MWLGGYVIIKSGWLATCDIAGYVDLYRVGCMSDCLARWLAGSAAGWLHYMAG